MKMIEPKQCPKYSKCSAPICPLDPDWEKRVMQKDDRTCFYLNEASKPEAAKRFEGRKDEFIFQIAYRRMPLMKKRNSILKKRLEKASLTGSRITISKS
jgi:hypothetical protein